MTVRPLTCNPNFYHPILLNYKYECFSFFESVCAELSDCVPSAALECKSITVPEGCSGSGSGGGSGGDQTRCIYYVLGRVHDASQRQAGSERRGAARQSQGRLTVPAIIISPIPASFGLNLSRALHCGAIVLWNADLVCAGCVPPPPASTPSTFIHAAPRRAAARPPPPTTDHRPRTRTGVYILGSIRT